MFKLISFFIGAFLISNAHSLYSPSDDVVILTSSNFQSKVVQSDELWFVEFFAPWCGHCKNLAPEWIKAAKALKGIVNIGAVDMDQDQSVGGPYNIRGFPTIKIFGSNKNSPTDYAGARTAQGIVDAAINQLKAIASERLGGKSSGGSSGSGSGGSGSGKSGDSKDVIELTDSNFESLVLDSEDVWLVEFFAPWCGHCKNLAPEWAKAATELKGKVKLGAVDATVHSNWAQKYGVRGYPTIKYFAGGKKDSSSAEDYDGGRTASDIVTWALNKYADNLPAPDVIELVEQKQLDEACDGKQLCIISVLPNILDCQSKCRNAYLDTLRLMGEKYKKQQWSWLWTDAMKQPDIENALSIGGFGYPAMAAVNSRKGKYVLLKGSFSETGINEFLRDLSLGRSSPATLPNSKLPAVVKQEPWDGKDGQLIVEEDIDLSDVELDDLDVDKKKTEL